MVRAKMKLVTITTKDIGWAEPQRSLRFESQYDQTIAEDQKFQKATPYAFAEFNIDNPEALSQFKVGECYYVDFSPAPKQ